MMNAVSVNKAEMCGEVSNRRGKSEEGTDAFFLVCLFFLKENALLKKKKICLNVTRKLI